MQEWRFWRPVEPGATLGVFAPAGPVDREAYDKGLERLATRYRIREAANVHVRTGYLSGDDAQRARATQALFDDPGVDALIAARGGYGTMRILAKLDYARWSRDPIALCGYSDLTALHMGLGARRISSIHGPVVTSFGTIDERDWSAFTAMLEGRSAESSRPGGTSLTLQPLGRARLARRVAAPFVGGNLSLISALVGTPWLPTFNGTILFLEDVGEKPYRIDRMIVQMALAGAFQGVHAIVLGDFTKCDPPPERPGVDVWEVLAELLDDVGVPTYTGYPGGHGERNFAFAQGGIVALEPSSEGPVTLHLG